MDGREKNGCARAAFGAVPGAFAFALLLAAAPALAAESFKGVTLQPFAGTFIAVREAPVLEAPDGPPSAPSSMGEAKSKAAAGKEKAKEAEKAKAAARPGAKKVADLAKGDLVEAFGKAGAWVAIEKGGAKLGFVAAAALVPVLDGTLAKDISGWTSSGGFGCRYAIRFEGRTEVEIGSGRIADYSASFECGRGATRIAFEAPMFMSEIPHQGGPKPIYQIAFDVLGVSPDPDQAFSTILFYDSDKGEVALETAWPADWLVKTKPSPRRAGDVAAAIAAAAELTLAAWGPKPWEALVKRER
jgi:hypothetical protein